MTNIIDYWHREYDTMGTLGYNLWMRSTPVYHGQVIVAPVKIYEDELRDCPDGPIPVDTYYAEPGLSARRYSAIKEYPGSRYELIVGSIVYGTPGFKADHPYSPNPEYDGFVDTGWETDAINEPFDKFFANQFAVLYRRFVGPNDWMLEIDDWTGSTQELLNR